MAIPEMSAGLQAHFLGQPLPEGVTVEDLRAEFLQREAAIAAEQAAINQPAATPTTKETTDVPGNNGNTEQPRKRG